MSFLKTHFSFVICLLFLVPLQIHAETRYTVYKDPSGVVYRPMTDGKTVLRSLPDFIFPRFPPDGADRLIRMPTGFSFKQLDAIAVLEASQNAILNYEYGPWRKNNLREIRIYKGGRNEKLLTTAIADKSHLLYFRNTEGKWVASMIGDWAPRLVLELPKDFDPSGDQAVEILTNAKNRKIFFEYRPVKTIDRSGQPSVSAPPDTYLRFSIPILDGQILDEHKKPDGYVVLSAEALIDRSKRGEDFQGP